MTRLLLMLGAQAVLAGVVDLAAGGPPRFAVTVVFGASLALVLAAQSLRPASRSGG